MLAGPIEQGRKCVLFSRWRNEKEKFCCIKWKVLVIWKAHFGKQSSLMASDSYYMDSSIHLSISFPAISCSFRLSRLPTTTAIANLTNYNIVC